MQAKIDSLGKRIEEKDLEKFTRKLYIHRQKDRKPKDKGDNGMRNKVIKITKEDFEAYARIQRRGDVDMSNISLVSKLSGLNKDKICDIAERYRKVSRRFKFIRD